jgi:hypothetical protein
MLIIEMIYIGYPVRMKEAYRIFGQQMQYGEFDYKNDKIMSTYLREYGLDVYSTDKGQYIIGIQVNEFNDMWNHFTNVDESITLLLKYKKLFKEKMRKASANTGHVVIEYMESCEDDAEIIFNPEPYVINWN